MYSGKKTGLRYLVGLFVVCFASAEDALLRHLGFADRLHRQCAGSKNQLGTLCGNSRSCRCSGGSLAVVVAITIGAISITSSASAIVAAPSATAAPAVVVVSIPVAVASKVLSLSSVIVPLATRVLPVAIVWPVTTAITTSTAPASPASLRRSALRAIFVGRAHPQRLTAVPLSMQLQSNTHALRIGKT
jgi:hypothetical protein